MRRLKIFSLILGIVCLTISGIAIFNNNDNDDVSNKNNEREIETINTEDKIGVNTDFVIETLYTMCGHTIIEKVEIDKSVSLPIKVNPSSFNSNLIPVKTAIGVLFVTALDTMFNALVSLFFEIINLILFISSFLLFKTIYSYKVCGLCGKLIFSILIYYNIFNLFII